MEKKKLILDYSKWRCGGDGPNKLGLGQTNLQNTLGYQCCLGQFTKQLVPKIDNVDLIDVGYPQGLKIDIPFLTFESKTKKGVFYNTILSANAIPINDDVNTTPLQKIEKLKELFPESNIEIEVINLP